MGKLRLRAVRDMKNHTVGEGGSGGPSRAPALSGARHRPPGGGQESETGILSWPGGETLYLVAAPPEGSLSQPSLPTTRPAPGQGWPVAIWRVAVRVPEGERQDLHATRHTSTHSNSRATQARPSDRASHYFEVN